MTDHEFEFICSFLQERSAIVLEPGKEYLVETRLAPIVKHFNLDSIGGLVQRLRDRLAIDVHTRVVEAMVTTETLFFRDHHPFETLRKTVLPELIAKRRTVHALNIWCAACSTGQEPYSLAILIREHFPELLSWKVTFLASDLSGEMLARARAGRYTQLEVNRGMPATLLVKYFQQEGTSWRLNANVLEMVELLPLNLAKPWPFLPRMDLILNRNVMIYFDVATKKSILSRMAQLLRPDGYLLLGGAEATFGIEDSFRRVENLKSGFYQLTPR